MMKSVLVCIVYSTTLVIGSIAHAQSTQWVGGGGNNLFSNALNWSDGAPGPSDDALFLPDANTSTFVNVSLDELIESLAISGDGQVTLAGAANLIIQDDVSMRSVVKITNQLSVTCQEYSLTGAIGFEQAACSIVGSFLSCDLIRIGSAGAAELTISDGGLVESTEGSFLFEGTVNVTGANSRLTLGDELRVAIGGIDERDATVNVLNGGIVEAELVNIGFNGTGLGTVNVIGSQSKLMCGGVMHIGPAPLNGRGELNISDFGQVTVIDCLKVQDENSEITLDGNASLIVAGGIENVGTIAFNGTGLIDADVNNQTGSELRVGPNSVGNVSGDLVHNGDEVFVASSAQLLICGNWSGEGPFVGNGRVDFESGVRPGLAGIGSVTFEGDVNFGSDVAAQFHIAGTNASHMDRLIVDDNVSLGGTLDVILIGGFQLPPFTQFVIIEVGDNLTGTFQSLPEGALVGNFGGVDLFITYTGGDGNDVALFTKDDPVLLGDVNLDGVVNLLDVTPFVDVLVNNLFQDEADTNQDGSVDLLDVAPFVALLSN